MSEALTMRDDGQMQQALTANEVRAHVNRIQEIMRAVMKEGIHYGKVPGCGDKPTLLKPGAEKILATFQIAVDPQIESETRTPDEYTVRIRAVATSPSGRPLGAAVGEASSNEEKYRWRRSICQEEYDATPEDRRRMAFKKYKGDVSQVPQIRTNVADISNTVLKMGVKRAEVAACLQVTAASDIFTQDIEDLPEGMETGDSDHRPPIQTPQAKTEQQAPAGPTISEAQAKRLFALASTANVSQENLRLYLRGFGFEHTHDVTKALYSRICAWTENGGQEATPGDARE